MIKSKKELWQGCRQKEGCPLETYAYTHSRAKHRDNGTSAAHALIKQAGEGRIQNVRQKIRCMGK